MMIRVIWQRASVALWDWKDLLGLLFEIFKFFCHEVKLGWVEELIVQLVVFLLREVKDQIPLVRLYI